jgi:hypothetical protein
MFRRRLMKAVSSLGLAAGVWMVLLCANGTWAGSTAEDGSLTRSEQEVLSGWLGDTRVGVGLEYEHARHEMAPHSYYLPFEVDNATADAGYVRLVISVTDRFDIWGRLGIANVEAGDFKDNSTPVYGGGLRMQVWKQGPWSWDVGGQVTGWSIDLDSPPVSATLPPGIVDGNTVTVTGGTLDDLEWLVRTGPRWSQGPLTVYGGVLARYSEGNLSFPFTFHDPVSDRDVQSNLGFTVNGDWSAGAYAGVTWQLPQARVKALGRWSPDCLLNVEGGVAGSSSFATAGLVLVPSGLRQ